VTEAGDGRKGRGRRSVSEATSHRRGLAEIRRPRRVEGVEEVAGEGREEVALYAIIVGPTKIPLRQPRFPF